MKKELSLLARKALFGFAKNCGNRADFASRRNQMIRAKVFFFLWEKSLDLRDTLR